METAMKKENLEKTRKIRKTYHKPKIIQEFELETQAGSVVPPNRLIDPDGNDLDLPEP